MNTNKDIPIERTRGTFLFSKKFTSGKSKTASKTANANGTIISCAIKIK
jgi:hypothetical protein